jgi:hypothetical protein
MSSPSFNVVVTPSNCIDSTDAGGVGESFSHAHNATSMHIKNGIIFFIIVYFIDSYLLHALNFHAYNANITKINGFTNLKNK